MKDSFFWRFIAVAIVVSLFAVAYGSLKNSPLPTPSFSSTAYADEVPKKVDELPKLIFQTLNSTEGLRRAKVPGGWLIVTPGMHTTIFYPDQEHQWDGGSVP